VGQRTMIGTALVLVSVVVITTARARKTAVATNEAARPE